jgi:menaquinone-dependent protoporphyrinogen oxidase
MLDLKEQKTIDMDPYDTVVLGGAIHAGRLDGKIRSFSLEHKDQLLKKKLGLFICGMEDKEEEINKQLSLNYPEDLLSHAVAKTSFGGQLLFSRMAPITRWFMQKMSKSKEDIKKIRTNAIKEFAQALAH